MSRAAFAIPRPTLDELERSPSARRRVLLVDDEPLLLRSMKRLLSMHAVTIAETVAEAKRILAASPDGFDVVIADLGMPDGGGRSLHAWLEKHAGVARPRIVFATGGAEEEDVAFLRESGCACMPKPVPFGVLREAIEIA